MTLNLSLASPAGSGPAALQWTLAYPPSIITAVNATVGAAGTAAGKSLICTAGAGTYTCILWGANTKLINNGVAAAVTATLAPGAASGAISVANTLGASPSGVTVAVSGIAGTVFASSASLPTLSTFACTPTSLSSGDSAICTVNLTAPAPAGGAAVSLATTSPNLTMPALAFVAPGNTAVSFNALAGVISASNTATLTAALNGSSKTAVLSLVGVSVNITPGSVTLQAGATEPFTAAVTGSSIKSVAWSVSPLVGSVSLSGLYTAPKYVNSPATVTITATSAADPTVTDTAQISLQPTGLVTDWPFDEMSGTIAHDSSGSGNDGTVGCSGPCAPGPTWSAGVRNGALNLPANGQVSVPDNTALRLTGQLTLAFWFMEPAPVQGNYISKLSTGKGSTHYGYTVSLGSSIALNVYNGSSTGSCSIPATLVPIGTWQHLAFTFDGLNIRIYLHGALAATCASNVFAGISTAPLVLGGASTAMGAVDEFRMYSRALTADEVSSVYLDAGIPGPSMSGSTAIAMSAAAVESAAAAITDSLRPTTLTCPPSVEAGHWFDCEVRLNSTGGPAESVLSVVSENPNVRMPARIRVRPGQTRLAFRGFAGAPAAGSSLVTVQVHGYAVSAAVAVTASASPVLQMPDIVAAAVGREVTFHVLGADVAGVTPKANTRALPRGATFDDSTGTFRWTPQSFQKGVYRIGFTAGAGSQASEGFVTVTVDSGEPVVTAVRNAASHVTPACSPGSVASLVGHWLTSASSDIRVQVNGADVPVVDASSSRIDFVCPEASAGTELSIVLETADGRTEPVRATMSAISPGLYSIDGAPTGQGRISILGSSAYATARDYRDAGRPAEPGEVVSIRATGIPASEAAALSVSIGGLLARVVSVTPAANAAGAVDIAVEVPWSVQEGSAIPVIVSAGGVASNQVTLAVERSR